MREFSKSQLLKVTELATRKQVAAEQRYRRLLGRVLGLLALVAAAAAAGGAGVTWWVLTGGPR